MIDNINVKTIILVLENRLIIEGNDAKQCYEKCFLEDFFFLEDMSKFNEFEYLMFVVFKALEE